MPSVFERISRFFLIVRLSLAQRVQRNRNYWLARSRFCSPNTQPNLLRSIPRRSDLYQARVFRPSGKRDGPLPLVVFAHGGGWLMNGPWAHDAFTRLLSDTVGCVVISVDYRKIPMHAFPAAYEDIVTQTLILIEDPHLEVDRSRVALCGWSAGANMVLAASQDARLRGKLVAVAAVTPPVDLTLSGDELMATRPDPSVPDFLGTSAWNMVLNLYASTTDTTKLRDPRLSPAYFKHREDLPKSVFIVGCEHDLICSGAKEMAAKLAAGKASSDAKLKEDAWEVGDVRWRLVKGQTHGFDGFPKKDPEQEQARLRDVDSMYGDLTEWFTSVFEKT